MLKIIAIIQARMSSSRLPEKSMMLLEGKPLIHHVLFRVQSVVLLDEVWLATSSDETDDLLSAYVEEAGYPVFRGDLQNVFSRFDAIVDQADADAIVRVTGDNPLIEPSLIEALIASWMLKRNDYISCEACIPGVGAEIFSRKAFKKARQFADDPYVQEHVTPPFYQKKDFFKTDQIPVPQYLKPQKEALTVDTSEDFQRIEKIYQAHYHADGMVRNQDFLER